MNGTERRMQILTILKNADGPVTGRTLAKAVGVARQIVVGDVALLRSSGAPIMSSARGYALEVYSTGNERRCLTCRLNPVTVEQLQEELDAVVDNGGAITGVSIHSKVYGLVRVKLVLRSRRDVRLHLQKLEKSQTPLLSTLTAGLHTLTVETQNPEEMEDIIAGLKESGLLVEKE